MATRIERHKHTEALETLRLIQFIGGQKMLRVEQLRDQHGWWRAGIEWYSPDNYEYFCEHPTLLECLQKIKTHMEKHPNPTPPLKGLSESLCAQSAQLDDLAARDGVKIVAEVTEPEGGNKE